MHADMSDKEKRSPSPVADVLDVGVAESQDYSPSPRGWMAKIASWGVELRGVTPVPIEERKDLRFINVFFVWFTMSTNLLPYV